MLNYTEILEFIMHGVYIVLVYGIIRGKIKTNNNNNLVASLVEVPDFKGAGQGKDYILKDVPIMTVPGLSPCAAQSNLGTGAALENLQITEQGYGTGDIVLLAFLKNAVNLAVIIGRPASAPIANVPAVATALYCNDLYFGMQVPWHGLTLDNNMSYTEAMKTQGSQSLKTSIDSLNKTTKELKKSIDLLDSQINTLKLMSEDEDTITPLTSAAATPGAAEVYTAPANQTVMALLNTSNQEVEYVIRIPNQIDKYNNTYSGVLSVSLADKTKTDKVIILCDHLVDDASIIDVKLRKASLQYLDTTGTLATSKKLLKYLNVKTATNISLALSKKQTKTQSTGVSIVSPVTVPTLSNGIHTSGDYTTTTVKAPELAGLNNVIIIDLDLSKTSIYDGIKDGRIINMSISYTFHYSVSSATGEVEPLPATEPLEELNLEVLYNNALMTPSSTEYLAIDANLYTWEVVRNTITNIDMSGQNSTNSFKNWTSLGQSASGTISLDQYGYRPADNILLAYLEESGQIAAGSYSLAAVSSLVYKAGLAPHLGYIEEASPKNNNSYAANLMNKDARLIHNFTRASSLDILNLPWASLFVFYHFWRAANFNEACTFHVMRLESLNKKGQLCGYSCTAQMHAYRAAEEADEVATGTYLFKDANRVLPGDVFFIKSDLYAVPDLHPPRINYLNIYNEYACHTGFVDSIVKTDTNGLYVETIEGNIKDPNGIDPNRLGGVYKNKRYLVEIYAFGRPLYELQNLLFDETSYYRGELSKESYAYYTVADDYNTLLEENNGIVAYNQSMGPTSGANGEHEADNSEVIDNDGHFKEQAIGEDEASVRTAPESLEPDPEDPDTPNPDPPYTPPEAKPTDILVLDYGLTVLSFTTLKNIRATFLSIAEAEKGYHEKKATIFDNLPGTGNKRLRPELIERIFKKTSSYDGSGNWNKFAWDIDEIITQERTGIKGRKNGYAWCTLFTYWCFWALAAMSYGLDSSLYSGAGALNNSNLLSNTFDEVADTALQYMCLSGSGKNYRAYSAGCIYLVRAYMACKRFFFNPCKDSLWDSGQDPTVAWQLPEAGDIFYTAERSGKKYGGAGKYGSIHEVCHTGIISEVKDIKYDTKTGKIKDISFKTIEGNASLLVKNVSRCFTEVSSSNRIILGFAKPNFDLENL